MSVTRVWVVSQCMSLSVSLVLSLLSAVFLTLVCLACVCLRKSVCRGYTQQLSECVMCCESAFKGRSGDVMVWEIGEKKQMSSADGYPAVASSWDTHSCQMLRGEQQPCVAARIHIRWWQLINWRLLTSLPVPLQPVFVIGGSKWREEIWTVEKTQETSLYSILLENRNIAVRVISHRQ